MKTLQELVEFIRAQARTHGTSLTKMEEEFDRNLVTKAYLREINNVLNSKGRV